MATVLVGIDGSEDSRAALRYGAALAHSLGASLRALWAWQYPSDTVATIGRIELPEPSAADALFGEQLDKVVHEELGEEASEVTTEVARGPAVTALRHRAKASDVTVIVVGSRGLGGFRGLLLGSVSQQLCEHAPCPVTVVGRGSVTIEPTPERIVAGHDGSAHAAQALTFAGELATRCEAKLIVAYATGASVAIEPGDVEDSVTPHGMRETVDGWCAPLRDAGVDYDLAIVEGDARTALLEAVQDHNADLLVVGTRGRGAVAKLLLGSVAASLVRHADLPVTVVPRTD